MASVNPLSRELVFKIVYYGPGLGGKTTTLEHIHATAKPDHRGKLVSLATPVDRTLYFDFLPMRLPPIRGMHVRLQLFTVPGQVYFNATRKLVLTGADGVVFVADAQTARADANQESLDNLRDNLADQGRNLNDVPIVFQYNKYDLPDVLSVEELDKLLNRWKAPSLATSARTGLGVYEGLERITHAVLSSFETQMPESVRVTAAASFDPNEEGLAAALRGASQGEERPPTSGAIFNRVASSRVTVGSIPPETGAEETAPQVDKVAMRAAGLPVTTFPELSEDGLSSKEKLAIAPASEGSILTRTEGGRAHSSRSPESRSGESPRSRNRPSVLPPKPFAPLIPQAGPPRTPAAHAPVAPSNATITTKEHTPITPPVQPTITTKDHTPAPPAVHTPSASSSVATSTPKVQPQAATPTRTAAAATKSPAIAATETTATAREDRAPSTERTIAIPVKPPTTAQPAPKVETAVGKVEVVPTKPESAVGKVEVVLAKPEPVVGKVEVAPAKPEPTKVEAAVPAAKEPAPFERLDPTQLLSIADLLEPAPERASTTSEPEKKAAQPSVEGATPPPPAATTPSKRLAAEPEPAPHVATPPPAELAPLPLPPRNQPSAATKAPADEPAKAAPPTPVVETSEPAPAKAEVPIPAPPPPPPARAIGSVHVAHEPAAAERPVATPLTTKEVTPADKGDVRKAAGMSFAELWPESDRALVHDVETAIAAGRCSEAIDLADTLVVRILTSTATLFGSTDSARDATSMPHLLGIDGRRYLAFRSIVRASRSGAKASTQDALAAYAFAIEARMAKSSVR